MRGSVPASTATAGRLHDDRHLQQVGDRRVEVDINVLEHLQRDHKRVAHLRRMALAVFPVKQKLISVNGF